MDSRDKSRSWSSQGRDDLTGPLREVKSPYVEFDNASNPQRKAERADMERTEAERRREQGEGSQMVKLSKPFPELKPKNATPVLRQSFNQNWLAEQRRAEMDNYRAQALARADEYYGRNQESKQERHEYGQEHQPHFPMNEHSR